MSTYRKLFILFLLSLFSYIHGISQQVINVNETTISKSQTMPLPASSQFKGADRVRPFFFNNRLKNVGAINKGEVLLLDFFDDKQYQAVVVNTATYGGVQTISGKISGSDNSFCYISISNRGVYLRADLPGQNESFIVGASNGQTYLQQFKLSELENDEISCGNNDVILPQERMQMEQEARSIVQTGLEEPVTIDLLIAYTPAAKRWADGNSSANGIDNLIATIMNVSNQVLSNSKTGITLNLVHKYQTNYVETNTVSDLRNFRGNNDGYMDEVHTLRKQYKADLILLLCDISYVGGQAYLLRKTGGDPEGCSASIVRVQQAASYSSVHEIGHNMGCHHHKDSEGPGLFSYSMGWRAVNSKGVRFSTVMPNPKGSDGLNYPRIPHFSSPDNIVDGTPTGDVSFGNNVLSLKRVKQVVSKYSEYFSPETETAPPTISISAPINNATVTTNSVTVTANASAASGNTISKVDFLLNGALKSTKTAAPYTASVGTLNNGTNTIVTKAYDSKGKTSETSVVVNYSTSGGGGGNNCGHAAWVSTKAYSGGDKVYFEGYIYEAAYWTQNNRPDQNYGLYGKPWKDNRVLCDNGGGSVNNTPPTVSISSPTNGSTVTTNSVNVTANASAASGSTMSKVEFYLNNSLKSTKTAAPYTASMGTLTNGNNTIKVKAYDNKNLSSESSILVNYSVPTQNIPPTISITTPANGTIVRTTTVDVSTKATDSDGTISKIEIYLNGTLKTTVTTAMHNVSIGLLNTGNNTIMAKAFDNNGATATATVSVVYNAPGGGETGNCMGVAEWISSKAYNKDEQVKEGDIIYKANYWTQNNRPSVNNGSGKHWTVVSRCDGSMDVDALGETQICDGIKILVWKKENVYDKAGTNVVYEGKIYTNGYWTQGNIPSAGGAWKLVGPCK